ncbi:MULTISPECIES: hypothetical protein [Microbacterium]|jgi:hypothetical protein|uniref:hypothetical protein n=1 Tax=Microbacterium TaxID=33882 RepID=UPI000903130B|nr:MULTISPECIES: hypothetical protein [Microbacterium]APF34174.1 hypothetical protein BO218_08260 [Microbacterium paludicola]POX67890.1 hypothetical protein C3481_06845 [Microbacterium sp. Ru50]
MPESSAASAARELVESGRGFDAALIERAAFADEPAVQELLDASDEERRRPVGRRSMFRSLGVALLEFLPIIAAGVVVIPARTASDLTVPTLVAGALAIVAAASRPMLWRQLASGRAEASGSQLSINAVSVLFAAFAIIIVALRSDDTGAPGLIIGAFAVQGIASAVTVAAIVRAGRRAGGSSAPRTGVEALRAAVGALPGSRQEQAREDIATALRVAVDGGILSESDAATLTRAPLGGLARAHWALSQTRR